MDVLDGVISELRSVCASLPDKRTGSNIRHEMADFGLSALSLFLMQSPSFLAHQRALSRARERSNPARGLPPLDPLVHFRARGSVRTARRCSPCRGSRRTTRSARCWIR